jgi:hypothetical protein
VIRPISIITIVALATIAVATGGAAAQPQVDVVKNASDRESDPLPPGYGDFAVIRISDDDFDVDSSTISTTLSNVTIDDSNDGPALIYAPRSELPESGSITEGVTYEIGSNIYPRSATLKRQSYRSDSISLNQTVRDQSQTIKVVINSSDIDGSDFGLSDSRSNLTIDLHTDNGSISSDPIDPDGSDITTTLNRSTDPNQWNATIDGSQNGTIYFHDSIERIDVDGERVYQSGSNDDDEPLGGGGGGSDDGSGSLILIAIIAAIIAAILTTGDDNT